MSKQTAQPESRNDQQSERTVLFVDDEPGILGVYEGMYGSEYDVLTAASGKEAIQMFGEHIDFAFLDRQMPRMSGDEVLETIRGKGYHTPVGILSAVEPETDLPEEVEEYITKPADSDDVRSAIDEHTP